MSQINQQLAGLFTPIDVNIVGGGGGGGPVTVTNTPLPIDIATTTALTLPPLSGTSNVAVTNFPATQPISAASLPALNGTTNVSIGTVTQTATSLNTNVTNTVPVTGTFFQATQPVSVATLPALGGTSNVAVTNFPATQPVSAVSLPALSGTTNVNVTNASIAVTGTTTTTIGTVTQTGTSLNVNTTNGIQNRNIDAFSRIRTSNPATLLAIQQQYDNNPLLLESGATGAGTTPVFNTSVRVTTLSVAGAGTSWVQSYEYTTYQPGKSQLIAVTSTPGAGVVGVTKDIGYFDAANGVFFRVNGVTNLQFVLRSSTSGGVVDTAIAQSNWNVDKLDGTGATGITLDITKAQICIFDLQFLGMGRVRCAFDIDGQIIVAHEFRNANSLTVPYMQSASLPVQILLTSAGNAATMTFKCAAVMCEGGFAEEANLIAATPSVSVTAGNNTRTHAISIRPKTTFATLTNRSNISIDTIEIIVTGSTTVFWELCVGANLSASAWSDVNTTFSSVEYTTSGTFNNLTNGVVLLSGFCAASTQTKSDTSRVVPFQAPITLNRAGAQRELGTLTLLVKGLGATSATTVCINFAEYR